MKKRYFVALAMVFAALVAVDSANAVLKTVAIQGDPSPNVQNYRRVGLPAASDAAANVAFFSPIDGGDKCIFIVDPDGGGATLVCEGDLTPDGRLYGKLHSPPSINVAGVPAFAAKTTIGFDGVYRGAPPTVVALTNDPYGPQFLDNMTNALITDSGDVVFLTEPTGGAPGDKALLRCSGGDGNCSPTTVPPGTGTLTTLVRLGDSIPDRPGREVCSLDGARASSFGVAFAATTKMNCADDMEESVSGIFRQAFAGPIVTVALAGELSGVGPTTYSIFRGLPALANNGKIGFQASLAGTPSGGLFVCDPALCPAATPAMAVEIGQLDGSMNLFRTFSAPGISDAGDLAFNTRLSGGPAGVSNGLYIWRSATDTFDVVGRKNDPVPGMPGTVFNQFLQGPPVMTPAGKVAFKVRIKRSVAPRNRFAIFIDE